MKLQKRVMAFLLVLVMMVSLMPMSTTQVQAAQVDIDLGTISWGSDYSTYTFPNVTVNFDNAKQKIFCLSVDNGGTFILPSTINLGAGCKITGIEKTSAGKAYQETVTGGMELSSLTVIGSDITETQVADFIKSLTFYRNVTDKKTEQTVSVVANEVELKDNETAMAIDGVIHYYEYVTFDDVLDENDWVKRGELTWYDAYKAAKISEFEGMNGYLATITEENEQLYIYGALGGKLQAWIGGMRTATDNVVFDADAITSANINPGEMYSSTNPPEKTFYWMCGPEAGFAFYQTGDQGTYINGVEINDAYIFWNDSNGDPEPNNRYSNATSYEVDPYAQEYALEYGYNDMGYWNDYSPYNTSRAEYGIYGYIIEYSPYKLTGSNQNPTEEKEATPSSTDSKIVAANEIVVSANDFIISTTEAKNITDEIAKNKAELEVTEGGTTVSEPNANITVDAEDLADVMTGQTGTYNVTYTYTSDSGNSSADKATVTVVDVTDVSTDGSTVIGANNFNISQEQAEAIANGTDTDAIQNLIKELANAVATKDGEVVDSSEIQITKNDIAATGEGPFDVTFTYNGETVTVQATVKDDGPTDGGTNNDLVVPSTNLTANDFSVEINSPELSADDFIKKADVEANKNDGSNVTPIIDSEDLATLNKAITDGTPGTYTVDVSTSDGTKTTVTVKVTGEYPSIEANDFIITVNEANIATTDTVKSLSGAARYESEGSESGTENVMVSGLNTLNTVSEPGVVDLTLKDGSTGDTAADKEVTATVVDEKTPGISNDGNNSTVVIGANNFSISQEQADAVVNGKGTEDVDALLKALANAVATEDGSKVTSDEIEVTDNQIDNTGTGPYEVTFTYKGVSVTVDVTVKDNGSTDGGSNNDLTIPTTNLTANDFTIDAGSPTLDPSDFITAADVVAKDDNGSSVTPTINASDLADLNNAINNDIPGTYDVEVTTPDGTSTTVTVTVTKRYPTISGHDFIISVDDAVDVTESEVKTLTDAMRYETDQAAGDSSKVTVSNLTDLKNQSTAGEVEITLKDTTSGNPEDIAYDKTVTATVVDATSTSDVNATVVVGANNFCITVAQAETIKTNPTDSSVQDLIKILANAVATDDGSTVNPSQITVDASKIDTENGSYDVTFTYDGETVTVKATVKDDGGADNTSGTTVPNTNLTANDFAVEKGGDELSPTDFLDAADVVAKENDGTPVTPTVNQNDLDKLNDAIKNGPTGDYTVTVTAPDGTSTKVTVSVTDVKTDETGKIDTIAANNFTVSVDDVDKITGTDALAEIIKRSDAQAYDVDTKNDVDIVSVDTSDVGNTPGETYNIVLKTENGTETTIQVTVTSTPSITANDFNVSIEQAQTIVTGQTDTDVQDMVKILANAVAKEDTTVQDASEITVDTSKVKAAKGTYPVTFTYNGKTVTVNATVKDTSAADGDADKTDVPEVNLTANDFAVQAGSTQLSPADFNKKAEVVAKKNNGTVVTATPDATDLAKLNNAIKNCQEGTYDVKVTAGGKTVVVTVTVTKEKDVVGDDQLFEISNAKDIPQDLDKGREVSTVNVDGADIPSSKYTIDGDTITIDSSVFQKKKAGTTSKVVITYKDGSKRTFNVKIVSYDKTTVVTKVPIFQMQKDLGVGKKFTINLIGMNKYAVKSFKSSNKKIATVNKNGVITGKKKGKCTITAKIIQKGSYYTVKIKLHVKKSMKMYNLKKKALQKQEGTLPEFNVYKRVVKGKKTKMKFTNVDKNAKITYTTSNKKIATVSKKGVIKGKKKGFCVITAKIEQRGHAYYTKLIVRVDDGTKNKQLKKYLK